MGMCLISLHSINAATITVNPGHSIQNAVNHASNGDTIIVNDNHKNPYTYKESITLNKKINITANGKVTIEAKNTNSAVFTVNENGAGSTIQKFSLTKSSYSIMINNANNCIIRYNNIIGASLVGIQFYGDIDNTKVISNNISGTTPKQGNGISFEYGTSTNNNLTGNIIRNFLNGILFNGNSSHNLISKNKVYSTGYHGAGIYATDNSRYMQITDNKIFGAEDGIAIQKIGSSTASHYLISRNTVKSNKNGFWIRLTSSTISYNNATQNKVSGLDITGSHNKIVYNTATGNGNCGITLGRFYSKDYNTVSYNTLTYNLAGINSQSHYTTISNNYVCYNKNNGIISLANNTIITGNTITNTARRIITVGTNVSCQKQ